MLRPRPTKSESAFENPCDLYIHYNLRSTAGGGVLIKMQVGHLKSSVITGEPYGKEGLNNFRDSLSFLQGLDCFLFRISQAAELSFTCPGVMKGYRGMSSPALVAKATHCTEMSTSAVVGSYKDPM